MYYPAGDELMVTFFPDDGYQARLRARAPEVSGEGIRATFELVDATNVRAGATPTPGFTLELSPDGKRMVQTWRFVEQGKESTLPLAFERP